MVIGNWLYLLPYNAKKLTHFLQWFEAETKRQFFFVELLIYQRRIGVSSSSSQSLDGEIFWAYFMTTIVLL